MENGKCIPSSWSTATVSDIGVSITGNTPATSDPENYGSFIPFVKPPQLTNDRIGNTPDSLSSQGSKLARIAPPFSVLVSCIGNLGKIGINKTPVAFNQQINAIVPFTGVVPAFLFYQAQSHSFRSQLEAKATATTISIVNKGNFETIALTVAPLQEQRRIVAKIEELFSELDKGIENLKTAQAQLKVYRQALLKHAFEGKLTAQWRADNPDKLETADALLKRIQKEREQRYLQQVAEWKAAGKPGTKPKAPKPLPPLTVEELTELPQLPKGWAWIRLGSTNVDVFDGPFGSNLKSSDYVGSGVRVIRLENIGSLEFNDEKESFVTVEKYESLKNHTVTAGDIIFSSFITESIRVVLLPANIEKAVNKADCFCVRLHGATLNSTFAVMFLSTRAVFKQLEANIHGVGRPRINTTQLKDVVIPICGSVEQQAVIAELECGLSEATQLDQTIGAALRQAEALRLSILKKAFSGRLVPQDPTDEPASTLLARIKAEKSAQPTSKKVRK